MGKSRQQETSTAVTPQRGVRLYRLLSLIADSSRTRQTLLKRLKVDLRGFYRDLELLRSLGVEILSNGDSYQLVGALDDALTKLPFPDPGLSFRDALLLSQGRTTAHRKLRSRIHSFTGLTSTDA
ncbi:hypothetical protein [Fimbriiglobus ruber]|uniref:Helix-turn-helix type 11 domain-containing protein n=1 Tax=Fimbriiglobus ruber TaxID=1908690 RepID=A0A225D4J5_9BACT|nr:hypothetical protein [Fimbriiglobus ruber]OWK34564.1 hypothetical protein FRUB_10535 [Fimbriiglobus ruber]